MKHNIDEILSEEQRMVLQNILSIQDYYNLKDHRKLVSIILNKKQSQELFNDKKVMISNVFEKQQQGLDSQAKINIFAEKYTYQNLVEKFKKPKSFKNNTLISVLKKKMEKQVIGSHNTRKSIWMLASGALFSMKNNKGLYEGLINFPDYPKYYEKFIMLDLPRTIKKSEQNNEDMKALQNVLVAFSRRNPYIGYCQGLNFIAFFLLTMQFNQEQAFWILTQITQTIIPMDYYTNMMGVACDQQIFLQVLRVLKPQIIKKFNQVGLDGSVLSIQWFVCLFTSSLPFYLVKIVWDRLIMEGTAAFIKAGLIILSHFEKQIMQTKQFYQIIMILQQGTKNLQVSEQSFNKQFQKYYINTQGLKIARDLYREFHIKQKLEQKVMHSPPNRPKKTQQNQCDITWPICIQNLNQIRKNRTQIQVWIYRQQSSPRIIHDYLQSIQKKPTNLKSTIHVDKNNLLKSASLKPSQASQFVTGRMQHICKNYKNEKKFLQTKFKKQRKYLSMVLEQEPINHKKSSNIEKILRLSAIGCDEGHQIEEENGNGNGNGNGKLSGYEKSQTIQFYSKFVQNNKQLAQMLLGRK